MNKVFKLFKIEINPNRIYGLDILRALAILFVVAEHGGQITKKYNYEMVRIFLLDGVSIFFVLSGFLIGGILIKLLKENTINTKLILNFWIRRWFRTIPNYLFILLILIILNLCFRESFPLWDKIKYFLFSQNIYTEHPHFFPEAWSLTVEEWFYLSIPIIIFFLIKVFKLPINKAVLFTSIGIILGVTIFRNYRFNTIEMEGIATWDRSFRKQVLTRLDSLMIGVIGGYIFTYFKEAWFKYKVPFFIVGICYFVSMKLGLWNYEQFGLFHTVFSFSTTAIATLFLIPYLSSIKKGNGIVYKAITYISLISYSMYLINLSIMQNWVLGLVDWSVMENISKYLFFISKQLFYWFVVITLSILLYKYFETPMTKLRDKVKIK